MAKGSMVIGKVGGIESIIHSPGKLDPSIMPELRSGCGAWKNKKKYDRKNQKREFSRTLEDF